MKRYVLIVIGFLVCFAARTQDLSELYERVSPGVVVIETEEKDLIVSQGASQQMSVGGLGTGFMVSNKQIVTAAHVVQTAEKVQVVFSDGEVIPAKVVSAFKNADVAMVELVWEKKNPTVLKLGDSDVVKTGQQIVVIGAPLGLEYSLSSGYISGRLATKKVANPFLNIEYFQTDAAINQGNSGGPMFNMKGEVIGIVSHILSQSGGFEGIGFAATSNVAHKLLFEENITWTGIDAYLLTGDMARLFNLPQPEGILVQKVVFHSPMGMMGVQGGDRLANIDGEELIVGGDIIMSIDGVQFGTDEESLNALAEKMKSLNPESQFMLKVLRGGKIVELKYN